ncbi:type IV pilus twitching motility protein PilT [Candidatus Marithrix sp. Canyon 246]|uniref:type IV pilus twitching motility protein PilT n=1 Tax=Candidatus Marithrix sp. Canyon 246 TaxID=1827136 RepID=UPI000849F83E|nr:type IV pilus twitching motility protein PilT [Candidatus Marithrix sp. Canyon 246]
MNIIDLLKDSVANGFSDVHLSAAMPPMVRLDGDLIRLDADILDNIQVDDMINELMDDKQRQRYAQGLECDFAFSIDNLARFRVNAYYHNRGVGAAIRILPVEIPNLEDAPSIFKDFALMDKGLIVVTGSTGSGKSTTLAAMLNERNQKHKGHILTLEDPIEFIHYSKSSLVTQREIERDTTSFATALRAALRQDPDVILVGELRDLETIRLALSAAETGHLVLATLHSNSAIKTIDRIIEVFPAAEKDMIRNMLSESLQAVIAQCLLKKQAEKGRIAAYEILVATPAVRNLIREHKIAQIYSAMQTGKKFGMQTMDQQLEG